MVIFHSYVKLPEGTNYVTMVWIPKRTGDGWPENHTQVEEPLLLNVFVSHAWQEGFDEFVQYVAAGLLTSSQRFLK